VATIAQRYLAPRVLVHGRRAFGTQSGDIKERLSTTVSKLTFINIDELTRCTAIDRTSKHK
jgi:hypothetical protein